MLADGSIVEANADRNQDLMWALKGGVNNFGSELPLFSSLQNDIEIDNRYE